MAKKFKQLLPKAASTIEINGSVGRNTKIGERFELLKALAEANRSHSWTNATVGAVARAIVGAGYDVVEHDSRKSQARKREKARLESFFAHDERAWDNIKDFTPHYGKIHQTVSSFILFGQHAWEIVRNAAGAPVGYDPVAGFVIPNVTKDGYFKSPAFYVRPWDGGKEVEYGVDDIAYFYNPGTTGSIFGETVYESLVQTTIPSDLYASLSYRELFENVNAPYNGVWSVSEDTSDEDYNLFLDLLENRYTGASNFGRNPLVIRGNAEFKPMPSRHKEDAPYLDGRRFNQEEISAVTGVNGNKLGLSYASNKANMRETDRDFHENVLRPLYLILEDLIYEQVIIRHLGVTGWRIKFRVASFSTALEQATIDARYISSGVFNPNEVRRQHGFEPRDGGDEYFVPANMVESDSDSSNTGEPNTDQTPPERPPRDEEEIPKILDEMQKWRKCQLRIVTGKRKEKEFITNYVPHEFSDAIKSQIDTGQYDSVGLVNALFDQADEVLRSYLGID